MEDYTSSSLAKTNVSAATQQLNFKLSLYLKEAGEKKQNKKPRKKKSDFHGIPALYLYPLKNQTSAFQDLQIF